MTRKEQIQYCKICVNQKFDYNQGIICGLTNSPASFEKSCDFFEEDMKLKVISDLKSKERTLSERIASKGKRFANYIIDLIFFWFFSYIFSVILVIVLVLVSPRSLLFFIENSYAEYLFRFIVAMIYYSSFEVLTGRTIAKFITKTKVVKENGEKPNFGTILIRSLCRFIPLEPFSFLGLENKGWHDRISKTIVIES